jgi:hypothetical protein
MQRGFQSRSGHNLVAEGRDAYFKLTKLGREPW